MQDIQYVNKFASDHPMIGSQIGFTEGLMNAGWDAIKGSWDLEKILIGADPQGEIDLVKNIFHAVVHPEETYHNLVDDTKVLWSTIGQSFEDDVLHGNAYTASKWAGYATGEVAQLLIPDGEGGVAAFRLGKEAVQLGKKGVKALSKDRVIKVTPKFSRESLMGKDGSIVVIKDVLSEEGVSLEEFDKLKLKPVSELTTDEMSLLKRVRDAIPYPTEDSIIQKFIPIESVSNYLKADDSWNTIGGCNAKVEDVVSLSNSEDVYDSMRLDYEGSKFQRSGDYAIIRFKSDDADELIIPYSKEFGDSINIKPEIKHPQSGNGFTLSENGQVIPEYEFPKGFYAKPTNGAELYVAKNGNEELVGVYSQKKKRFVPAKSN